MQTSTRFVFADGFSERNTLSDDGLKAIDQVDGTHSGWSRPPLLSGVPIQIVATGSLLHWQPRLQSDRVREWVG